MHNEQHVCVWLIVTPNSELRTRNRNWESFALETWNTGQLGGVFMRWDDKLEASKQRTTLRRGITRGSRKGVTADALQTVETRPLFCCCVKCGPYYIQGSWVWSGERCGLRNESRVNPKWIRQPASLPAALARDARRHRVTLRRNT